MLVAHVDLRERPVFSFWPYLLLMERVSKLANSVESGTFTRDDASLEEVAEMIGALAPVIVVGSETLVVEPLSGRMRHWEVEVSATLNDPNRWFQRLLPLLKDGNVSITLRDRVSISFVARDCSRASAERRAEETLGQLRAILHSLGDALKMASALTIEQTIDDGWDVGDHE